MTKPAAGKTRTERDSLGPVEVPADAYYGAQTARAVANFPVSGAALPQRFIHALGLVKLACARVNRQLGLLPKETADPIETAAREVADGKLDREFPIDVFQTGSGTSTNMNANEVIANRALEIVGEPRGNAKRIHPNDHVNRSQSSNDVIPTVLHVSVALATRDDLTPAMQHLHAALQAKSRAFAGVVKVGRTHLMDAVPLTLGQEVGAWATQLENGRRRITDANAELAELAIGGTAVGTGLNAPAGYGAAVARELETLTRFPFREAPDHFEAQASRDAVTHLAGALNTYASALVKIANDIRLLGSGPRTGIAELRLPSLQPGSSIMPGKVNPVIPESVIQACVQVSANCVAVTMANQWGQLQLNTMLPLLARNILESVQLLTASSRILADKCIAGLEADVERCRQLVERSDILVTALNPAIGYDKAAEVVKRAWKENRPVLDVVVELGYLPKADAERLLDPQRMTRPGGA